MNGTTTDLALSGDLGRTGLVVAVAVAALGVVLLAFELRRSLLPGSGARRGLAWATALSGLGATAALLAAVLRPVRVETDGLKVGPRVVVLVDRSRSMDLPSGSGAETRRDVAAKVVADLQARGGDVRLVLAGFGGGPALALDAELRPVEATPLSARPVTRSDLVAGLESIAASVEEAPRAIIVVSDGRLDRPTEEHAGDRGSLGLGGLEVPVHAVPVTTHVPADASIRDVRTAGAAVAHQPLQLRVEVGCSGGLGCDRVPIVARELVDRGKAEVLARGEVTPGKDAAATVELTVTLHRAGPRVLEIAIDAPAGDEVSDNDRRFVTLEVARDRIRILHIAGRPTYDVRALRTYLKSDESVDVVAFFILRTPTDSVGAPPNELALIPFPVDELFSVHLPSFDAVVLQDFNAEVYGLTKHLDNLARYVGAGGGLIMVGGPDAFGPGQYAGTPLAEVLPVKLTREHQAKGVDLGWFTPQLTRVGAAAPVLGLLRDVAGEGFPDMPGTNVVGAANPGATVLLTHPVLGGEERMPVLALGEYGTGRTIALTVDGTHRLLFSASAAERAGRAHGALWDGLLGWLMREPRFESTSLELAGASCVADEPSAIVLRPLPGTQGDASLTIMQLGTGATAFETRIALSPDGGPTQVELPPLDAGGYAASVQLGGDAGAGGKNLTPATRRDFACEKGGDEWSDTRPDPSRLEAVARATKGASVPPARVGEIPLPEPTLVSTQRKVTAVLPAWAWTTLAAALVGAHWIARRRMGLS